jgi:acyl carrier protein
VDQPDAVIGQVAKLVEDILQKKSISRRPVKATDDLVIMGLASVDMVDLMLAVEAAFDITIPLSSITPENFRSIATIGMMIEKLASFTRTAG